LDAAEGLDLPGHAFEIANCDLKSDEAPVMIFLSAS
jgi:hypothetical protein